jgi:hypothetical protein
MRAITAMTDDEVVGGWLLLFAVATLLTPLTFWIQRLQHLPRISSGKQCDLLLGCHPGGLLAPEQPLPSSSMG